MADLRNLEGDLEGTVARLAKTVTFAELMAQQETGRSLRLDSKATDLSLRPHLQGVIVRVWNGARWVESATSPITGRSLDTIVDALGRPAPGPQGPAPGVSATTRGEWETRVAKPADHLGGEEMIELARDALGWAKTVPGVSEVSVNMGWEHDERLYLNSAGARCWQRVSRVRATVAPIAMENGRAEYDYLSEGGIGGEERLAFLTEAEVLKAAHASVELLQAPLAPTGEMGVVLDASVSGLFAHESFGHGAEADQFLRDRSYLRSIVGTTVAPPFVTIADDGAFPGAWGSIYCDDEGHPGQKTMLIDHGRFVGALHDRETAAALGTRATGNTRRADFLSRAFVRMTNTYVEPGDRTFEELLEEVGNGVLLEHGTSGIEDPLGGQMQLKVRKGRRIEHGKLGGLVTSMALSGRVLDFLRAIRGVGQANDLRIQPGYCGKGHHDLVPNGTGGVPLASRAIVGPA